MNKTLRAQPPLAWRWKPIALLLALLFVLQPVFARSVQGIEEVKISLYLKDATLQKAFLAIEKKAITCLSPVLSALTQKKINVSLENKTVKEALKPF